MQAGVKKLGRKGRMPAQIIGAIGLTSTAAGAYYVATGKLDRTAIALWLANWLFAGRSNSFCAGAHPLQPRRQPGREAETGIALSSADKSVSLASILAACRFGLFPAAMALAFVPVLLRGTLWFVRRHRPLDVHKLGFSELTQALIFGALLCASFLV